jgi:predicted lipoprotein with Yx(FWY)xxD motif
MNPLRYAAAMLTLSMLAGAAAAGSMPVHNPQGLLAGVEGRTLYSYDPDGTSGGSHCEGPCAAVWPAYLVDDGLKPAGDFSATVRADGKRQWVYQGRPLYLFAGDAKPGDHDGDGVNGSWHVVH